MTISDSTRLIEAWAQAWSSPNGLEKLFSLFTDDCVYEDLGTGTLTRGKEELKDFFEAVFRAIPDFKVELTSHFRAGNWAGAEWIFSLPKRIFAVVYRVVFVERFLLNSISSKGERQYGSLNPYSLSRRAR